VYMRFKFGESTGFNRSGLESIHNAADGRCGECTGCTRCRPGECTGLLDAGLESAQGAPNGSLES
jgi:hypothetical protein